MKKKIRLGVNVDHVATLRQVRGGTTPYPDLYKMVMESVKGGAQQITIHLREDRRHIQLEDVVLLSKKCPVLLNLEMGATKEMEKIALKYKPDWVCLVPEKREELTTEGGLDVAGQASRIGPLTKVLSKKGIKVSHFIEPSLKQVQAAAELGAHAVEFHTGHWVLLKGKAKAKEWKRLSDAAELCHSLGMNVHAGHGLDYDHTLKIKKLPYLEEVNIGHSLICYSLEDGLRTAVRKMKRILQS
jgi:pyridoxine 5-phosphate synthase